MGSRRTGPHTWGRWRRDDVASGEATDTRPLETGSAGTPLLANPRRCGMNERREVDAVASGNNETAFDLFERLDSFSRDVLVDRRLPMATKLLALSLTMFMHDIAAGAPLAATLTQDRLRRATSLTSAQLAEASDELVAAKYVVVEGGTDRATYALIEADRRCPGVTIRPPPHA